MCTMSRTHNENNKKSKKAKQNKNNASMKATKGSWSINVFLCGRRRVVAVVRRDDLGAAWRLSNTLQQQVVYSPQWHFWVKVLV